MNNWNPLFALLAAQILFLGCADPLGESASEPVPESVLVEADEEEDETLLLTGEEEDFGTFIKEGGFIEDQALTYVISSVNFDLQPEEGIAKGFNLDGIVSDETDEKSCGHADQVNESGEEGIDNKIAGIFWIFKDLYGPQIDDLLQNAIQDGRLLVVIELLGVDDLENDSDVTVRWYRGAASPSIGFSGDLLSSQSYYIDDSMPFTEAHGATIVDGVLEAGPFDYGVPLEIFDANTTIQVREGQLRMQLGSGGEVIEGMMGGSVEIFPLLEELYQTGASSEAKVMAPYLEQEADTLMEDGVCQGMSMAAEIRLVSGFLIHY
jgi:hypothetical protein